MQRFLLFIRSFEMKIKTMIAAFSAFSMLFATQIFAGGDTRSQAMTTDESMSASIHRAEDLVGKTVYNNEGAELGDVNDVVFDESGNPSYLIVSRGGVLGIGDELVPIPWDSVDSSADLDGDIIADIDLEKFENAPSFGSLDEFDAANDEEVRAYYEDGMSTKDFEQREGAELEGIGREEFGASEFDATNDEEVRGYYEDGQSMEDFEQREGTELESEEFGASESIQ
jgi:sporulation protein YlmC with PRC-barrel domain